MSRVFYGAHAAAYLSLLVLAGCTTSERMGREEPTFVTEKLHSVVLLSGEQVVFDKDGGRYARIRTITGKTAAGVPVAIPQSEILQARSWRSPAVPLDSSRGWRFAEVLLKDSTLMPFDPPGGRCDLAKNVITGHSPRTADSVILNSRIVLEYRELAGTPINRILVSGDTTLRITELLLAHPSYRVVEFDSAEGRLGPVSEWVVGKDATGTAVSIPLDDILYGSVERIDAAKTVLGVVGGVVAFAAVVAVVALATKQSCPFIYSYDGTQYQFDAEPLGGATTEGLARTDWSRLKYLRTSGGTYRLLIRNEVNETQYVDEIGLCYVDHDSSRIAVSAGGNRFHLLPAPAPPIAAVDAHGANLLPFVATCDGIEWQRSLDGLPPTVRDVRDTLTFRFYKPPTARRAQIVFHGGTTQWGSNTIRLMYDLLGTDVDSWWAEADGQGPGLFRLLQFLDHEELYTMRVYVGKNGSWAERGTIAGGGPFVHETQAVPLNVSGISGDTLLVQVRPPVGFWSIDFAGIVYDDDTVCQATELPLLSAVDQDGCDIRDLISTADRRYFEMPTNHEEATLTFAAPPPKPGFTRTVFARTTGYYRLHLAKDHPPETALMERINSTPGEIVRYAVAKYREWAASMRSRLAQSAVTQ